MPQQEPFLVYGIARETREFLMVIGKYNFDVAKGFKQPVVALLSPWQSEYRHRFPFTQADRIEFVISLTAPTSTAMYGPTREIQRAAEASADFENNIDALKSLAADAWMRGKTIMSNEGVFQLAQARFRSRDSFALRQKYLSKFQPCPHIEHARIISAFCCPPEPNPTTVQSCPPIAKNQAEWDRMSEGDKARILFAHQDEWLNRSTPAVTANSSGAAIVIPDISQDDGDDWKGRPTLSREEMAELRSDSWKKY